MKYWSPAFVLSLLLPLGVQAAIGITTPTVNSGELIRASDWNKVKLDLETLAAATEALQNQSWSSSGADTYYSTGKVGIGLNNPAAELSVFLDTPNANDPLLQLGTTDDADRFTVDEDGDVTLDGKLVVRDSDIYESGGDLELSAEDNLYLSIDWNDDDTDTNALLFGKNSAGAGAGFAELMRIDEDGNVGIGTATPGSLLQVAGAVQVGGDAGACDPAKAGAMRYSGVAIERCDGASWDALATTSVSDNLGNHTATEDLDLATFKLVGNGGTDGISITSTGNVGIGGATAPTFELEVANRTGDNNVDVSLVTDATGVDAYSNFVTESPAAKTTLLAHGTGRSLTKYGQNVSGWGELRYNDLGGSNTGGLMVGTQQAVPVLFGTNDEERLRIDTDGDVGIGISSPGALLDIQKNAPAANETLLRVGTSSDNSRFEIDEDGDVFADGNYYVGGGNVVSSSGSVTLGGEDNLYLATDWNDNDADSRSILFGKNGYGGGGGWEELMRIDEDGNVGIDTNNPANKLHVVENSTTNRVAVLENQATTGSPEGVLVLTGQGAGVGAALAVGTGTPSVHTKNFVVTNAGTVGIGDPSPDQSLSLDIDGQIGATEYCDQNGDDCRSIGSMGGKFIDGTDTADAVFTGGFVGIGTTNPVFELEVLNETGDQNVNVNIATNASGADAYSNFVTQSPVTKAALLAHGLGRSVSRFGQNLSGWGEILYRDLDGTDNGLIIGTFEAVPMLFGTQNAERMRISADGHVGIGSTNPNNPLTVHAINSAESIAEFRGYDTSNNLTFLLENDSGTPSTTGIKVREDVTDVGVFRYNHPNSEWRVFAGGSDIADLKMVIEASGNVGIGTATPNATLEVSGGDILVNSLVVGRGAQDVATNTAVGVLALENATGPYNTAVGLDSMTANVGGFWNTALGGWSLKANTSGNYNTALGQRALTLNETGEANTAVGGALGANVGGSRNTSIGDRSSAANVNGNFNTAAGYQSLFVNVSGSNNTTIGTNAGSNLTAGDNNTAIGSGTLFPNATGSNQLNIANTIYGNTSTGNVGIGQTDPDEKLHVAGDILADGQLRWKDTLTSAADACYTQDGANIFTVTRCSSLAKLKDNVSELSHGINTVMQLRPVEFDWVAEQGGHHDLGFIAEEVAAIDPLLAEYDDGELVSVKYRHMTALLTKAIQDLKVENNKLNARLEALEQSN